MKELIKWGHPYEQIDPKKIDEYFEKGEGVGRSLSDLLLENFSTAIFHVCPNRLSYLGGSKNPIKTFMQPLLLGVNYHKGHSEGDYKIVVQNLHEKKGPWVLFIPPNSNEDIFYLQDMVFPRIVKPKFEENVANPLKINTFYVFRGNPLRIFEDFKIRGFKFVDEPMSEEQLIIKQKRFYFN